MSKLCIINTIKTKIRGNATSYIERENEIFIPKSDNFTLEQTYKIAVKKVDKINQEYLSEKFGKVVSLNTSASNGTGIKIHPSQLLIDAYEVKEGNKSIEELNPRNLDYFNGDEALLEQEQGEFGLESNLIRFSDLRQELRVQEAKLNFKDGRLNNFEILPENSVMDREISQQEAFKIFNKKYKTPQEKQDLSIYFANHFLNSVYDREGLLYLGYTRFLRYGVATPKLLVVKDNGRKNPFFQYNNTVVIGLKQIEKFIDNLKTPTFDKFENLINVVAQEEIIHLYADYLLNSMDIDNIYNEMTEKDISQIKRIYGNSSIQKENIVHEYVRMVVQQKVFGRTTEYESFTLSNALMSMFERLLEELNDFLSTIIGSTNTKKAIQDVIDFTKGNFSEELDKKIIARIFEKGQILEANLENLGEQLPNQLKTFIDESKKIADEIKDVEQQVQEEKIIKPGVSELFEENPELANSVYSALNFKVNKHVNKKYYDSYNNSLKLFSKGKNLNILNNIPFNIINAPNHIKEKYQVATTISEKIWEDDVIGEFKDFSDSVFLKIKYDEEYGTFDLFKSTKFNEFSKEYELIEEDLSYNIIKKLLSYSSPALTYMEEQAKITQQQKATAQQLYSQYLEQNPNGSVEQFKSWVDEFNRKTNLEKTSENKTIEELYKENPKLEEFINSVTDEDNTTLSLYKVKNLLNQKGEGRIVKLNNILYNAIMRLWDNNVFAQNNIKIYFVDSLPENAVGNFNRDDNEITIDKTKFLNIVNNSYQQDEIFYLGYILNHEIIHYLTPNDLSLKIEYIDRALEGRFGKTFELPSEKEFGKNIKELYDIANSQIEDVSDYGFTNLAEFVAEAMSNPNFQEKLASVPYKSTKKSLWKRFIEIVSAYLTKYTGKPINDTLLEAVLAEVTNYITENSNIQKTYKIRNKKNDVFFDFAFNTEKNVKSLSDFITQKSQERLNQIQEIFNENSELSKIGTVEQYASYLDTIFPNSKVKDIVYHGTDIKFDNFSKDFIGSKEKGALAYGFNFGGQQARVYAGNFGKGEKVLLSNLVSLQNPLILKGEGKYATASYPNFKENNFLIDILKKNGYDVTQWQYYKNSDNGKIFDYVTQKVGLKNFTNILKKEGYDGVLSITQSKENPEIVVFEPEQIHILGSKQDIENFAKFVKNNESGNTKDMENYMSSKSVDYIMDKLIQSGKIEKRC